jgi:hypothetical protein
MAGIKRGFHVFFMAHEKKGREFFADAAVALLLLQPLLKCKV